MKKIASNDRVQTRVLLPPRLRPPNAMITCRRQMKPVWSNNRQANIRMDDASGILVDAHASSDGSTSSNATFCKSTFAAVSIWISAEGSKGKLATCSCCTNNSISVHPRIHASTPRASSPRIALTIFVLDSSRKTLYDNSCRTSSA